MRLAATHCPTCGVDVYFAISRNRRKVVIHHDDPFCEAAWSLLSKLYVKGTEPTPELFTAAAAECLISWPSLADYVLEDEDDYENL